MIETATVRDAMDSDDGEDIHIANIKSEHVKSLLDCKKGRFYFVKAKVKASYFQVDVSCRYHHFRRIWCDKRRVMHL